MLVIKKKMELSSLQVFRDEVLATSGHKNNPVVDNRHEDMELITRRYHTRSHAPGENKCNSSATVLVWVLQARRGETGHGGGHTVGRDEVAFGRARERLVSLLVGLHWLD